MMRTLNILLLVMALVLSGCSMVASGQGKGSAKKTLETYLKLMKEGDVEKAEEYLETEGFIDVFDYKLLKELKLEKEKDEFSMSKFDYEEYLEEDDGRTWDEFLSDNEKLYSDKDKYETEFTDNRIYAWEKGKYLDQHSFLYDMEIANGLGDKKYRKVEFVLEWGSRWNEEKKDFVDGYVIKEINIRGSDDE